MIILVALLLLALSFLAAGIVLIVKRKDSRWYLPLGIVLILLFLASLPVVIPVMLIALLALSGQSFGP